MVSTKPLLVIVPALNEQETIHRVVSEIRAARFDVLVVDDGSTDNTADRAKKAGATVLRLPLNLGVGGALRAGFRFAIDHHYAAVVQVDADGQHPVSQIRDLVTAAEQQNAHLVIGSRYLSPDTTLIPTVPRRIAMQILSRLVSLLAGKTITDVTSGFRIICKPLLDEFAEQFPIYYLGDTFEAAIVAGRANYTLGEIPARLSPRIAGVSTSSAHASLLASIKVVLLALLHLHTEIKGPQNHAHEK